MKRLAAIISLLIMACSLYGCGIMGREVGASESAFMADFTLESVMAASETFLIAKHTISRGTESVPPEHFYQIREEAIVQVDPANASALMDAVRADIEQSIIASGATISGRGADRQGLEGSPANIEYFSFRYSAQASNGVINVWGVRGEVTYFHLIVLITES